MTITITDNLLSQLRGFDTKQLVKISNILQVEKDIRSFYASIPSNVADSGIAKILRENIVFPGNDLINHIPAIEHSSPEGFQGDLYSILSLRRFWYGVVPVTSNNLNQPPATTPEKNENTHLLFIECRFLEISMSLSGDPGGIEVHLIIQYRGQKKKAYVADYDRGLPPDCEDGGHDAGGVLGLVNEVIKDIGLDGKVQPKEMVDWLIMNEFEGYKTRYFYPKTSCFELDRGDGRTLYDVVCGLEEGERSVNTVNMGPPSAYSMGSISSSRMWM
ncbi:hypothetical protein K435DRAFT_963249 [Dendrothele bispora CBS 962.96]|uniref:Uncharacterized protein n=1 Tax=Dendrothele bispora (strain CBS 962.96) TaxID=1314807 RepID=A0A4S8MI25_DENBC|nr:hypothetical protein K435DRAFT_963249 [Dendrothele bispora CBS 962.96]